MSDQTSDPGGAPRIAPKSESFYQQPVEDLVTRTVAAVNKILPEDVLAYFKRAAAEHPNDASYSGGRAAFAEIAADQLELALKNQAALGARDAPVPSGWQADPSVPAHAIRQVVEQWRERAKERRPSWGVTDPFHKGAGQTYDICADDLSALLVGVERRSETNETKDEEGSRVETSATIPSTGSTAQTATGDK